MKFTIEWREESDHPGDMPHTITRSNPVKTAEIVALLLTGDANHIQIFKED